MELGVSTEVAKQLERSEAVARAAEAQKQQFINEQKLMEHLGKMNAQAVELQKNTPTLICGKSWTTLHSDA